MEFAVQDKACGIEQRLIDLENELEWAEAQGRSDDVVMLRMQLGLVMHELADAVEDFLEPPAEVHASRAA